MLVGGTMVSDWIIGDDHAVASTEFPSICYRILW